MWVTLVSTAGAASACPATSQHELSESSEPDMRPMSFQLNHDAMRRQITGLLRHVCRTRAFGPSALSTTAPSAWDSVQPIAVSGTNSALRSSSLLRSMATLSLAPCAAYDNPIMRVDWSGLGGAGMRAQPGAAADNDANDFTQCHVTGSAALSYESALRAFRSIEKPIDRYIALRDLLSASPQVYYALLLKHTEEILPYIYTVGCTTCSTCCQALLTLQLQELGKQPWQQFGNRFFNAISSCTFASAIIMLSAASSWQKTEGMCHG